MKDLIVFDLDGTLALIDHRRHLVECPTPNWDAFFAACVDDLPNPDIVTLFQDLGMIYDLCIVSGRSDEVAVQTTAWIFKHIGRKVLLSPSVESAGSTIPLIMRKAADHRPDTVLKEEWVMTGAIPQERVLCAFDDRDSVVKMWRRHGITCCQVAEGTF